MPYSSHDGEHFLSCGGAEGADFYRKRHRGMNMQSNEKAAGAMAECGSAGRKLCGMRGALHFLEGLPPELPERQQGERPGRDDGKIKK